ncbi:hypothetical protein DUI70_1890 [Streptomyces albus]|nr:hypothetical protein DUI70_1890 [Streptomyces albus]
MRAREGRGHASIQHAARPRCLRPGEETGARDYIEPGTPRGAHRGGGPRATSKDAVRFPHRRRRPGRRGAGAWTVSAHPWEPP